MLGLGSLSFSSSPIIPSTSKFYYCIPSLSKIPPISTTSKNPQSLYLKKFRICAQNGNDDKINAGSGGNVDEGRGKNGPPKLTMRWVDLLLDPDPDNILAVGLTGLLTWASVQVLWQLFVISAAILIAALKYSIVATLLIFILIALL